jgi:hypothetical protein
MEIGFVDMNYIELSKSVVLSVTMMTHDFHILNSATLKDSLITCGWWYQRYSFDLYF